MIRRFWFAVILITMPLRVWAIWQTGTLDGSSLGTYNSIAVNSLGQTCISTYDTSEYKIKYIVKSDDIYKEETVDTVYQMNSTMLFLEADDAPHICYRTGKTTIHTWRTDDGWLQETLCDSDKVPEIAMDSNDFLHLCHQLAGKIIYQYQNSSGWKSEELATGWLGAFDLSSDDQPHVIYLEQVGTDSILRYRYRNLAGEWLFLNMDSFDEYSCPFELRLDSDDLPHVFTGKSYSYYYAFYDREQWHFEDMKFVGYETVNYSFTLDSQNRALVGFCEYYDCHGYCEVTYHLYYQRREESGWPGHPTLIDGEYFTGKSVGQFCALTVDNNDIPRICYFDDENNDMKLAVGDFGWHVERITDSGDSGFINSLCMDADGYRHYCYSDYSYDDLRYLFEDESGIHKETIDTGLTVLRLQLVIDKGSTSHVAYTDSEGMLKYAVRTEAGWVTEIIEPCRCKGVSLIVDESGIPFVCYSILGDLKLGRRDEDGWRIETLQSDGLSGYAMSMVHNSSEIPHIACITENRACYIYFGNDGWQIEEIGPATSFFEQSEYSSSISMAIDSSNIPHVVYTNSGIVYARKTAEGWLSEMFDSGRISSQSLQLSSDGLPSVAYTHYGLRYAQKIDDQWCFNYVARSSGNNLSYVLDSEDRPYIAYYNEKLNFAEDLPPACEDLGVTLEMPSVAFSEGDLFSCRAYICNPGMETLPNTPLFVILDVLGSYYFAPEFNEFSHFTVDVTPGQHIQVVIAGFNWPAMDETWTGLTWYAALTDPDVTEIIGQMGTWRFDCN